LVVSAFVASRNTHVDAVDVFNISEASKASGGQSPPAKVAHWDSGGVLLHKEPIHE
jgi:hypothetical protein